MSTRSNIITEDNNNRIQLYRHHDGYPHGPEGVLATLERAVSYAWPLPRFEADDFAAALVSAWKNEGGGGIYIDGSPKDWESIHGGVEWVYLIKPQRKAKSKRDSIDSQKGGPIVHVYDWHKFGFEKADPQKIKPKPILKVKLSEAKKAGLEWGNKG